MKQKLEAVMLLLVGVINFLPVIGVFSAKQMAQSYAIVINTTDLELLLRHRALLFGVIGGFVLVSLIKPIYRPAAMILAGVSMAGFIAMALILPGINEALNLIFWMDVLGLVCLVAAVILHVHTGKTR